MTSLSGKLLGTGNYNFYTHWYQFYDIDFPAISTEIRHGKRIVILGRECVEIQRIWKTTIFEIPLFMLWNYITVMEYHYMYFHDLNSIFFIITVAEFLYANIELLM